jgi:hypothetical protein
MTIHNDFTDGGIAVAVVGLLVQILRMSDWVGEIRTKVDVMWHAMTNDLHLDLDSKKSARPFRKAD